MNEIIDISMLKGYQRKINDGISSNIKESITKLGDTISMLEDLNEISNSLIEIVNEQQNQIDKLKLQLELKEDMIIEKDKYIDKIKIKENEYNTMEIDALKIAKLVPYLSKTQHNLESEKKQFENEKKEFKNEKEKLLQDKRDAEEHVKILLKARDIAINSKDEAIAKQNKLIEDLSKKDELIENCNKKYEQELEKLRESVNWYKKYAIAIDEKIINYFEKKSDELKNHYNYYLNDPSKFEEIREHFPEYKMNDTLFYNNNSSLQSNSMYEDKPKNQTKNKTVKQAVSKEYE